MRFILLFTTLLMFSTWPAVVSHPQNQLIWSILCDSSLSSPRCSARDRKWFLIHKNPLIWNILCDSSLSSPCCSARDRKWFLIHEKPPILKYFDRFILIFTTLFTTWPEMVSHSRESAYFEVFLSDSSLCIFTTLFATWPEMVSHSRESANFDVFYANSIYIHHVVHHVTGSDFSSKRISLFWSI